MQPRPRTGTRSRLGVLMVFMLVIGVLAAAVPAAGGQIEEPETTTASTGYVTVQLRSPAIVHYEGGIKNYRGTAPNGKRFQVDTRAFRRYQRHLEKQHAKFEVRLANAAPNAVISDHFYITSNSVVVELNGADPAVIDGIKGTRKVRESGMVQMDMTDSRDLIGATETWYTDTGYTGAGIKVGVIDSGIVNSLIPGYHPFLACKDVYFGGVFYSGETGLPSYYRNPNAGDQIHPPGTPYIYNNPHGTHVAGTIGGCDYIFDGGVWDGQSMSGVAPGVELWDYNVFPGWGAGFVAFDGSAFSHDIADAIETAVADGMDVINMSLGGGVQGPHDFLQEAANSAVDAGVVVVTSAGNEGPGFWTVGSPGTGDKVIATAASTNSRGMGVAVTTPVATYYAMPAEFPDFAGITYDLIDWPGSDNEACTSDVAAASLSGEVVIIARGSCSFSQKVESAKVAGAGGVVVYNHSGDPIGMARTDGFDDELPAVMVSTAAGALLEGEAPTTAFIGPPSIVPTTPNILADFSSWGPAAFTHNVKPDVMAPGVDILSSTFAGFELYNGTSMASPHVAGAAALLLEAHPGWTPAQVKSAIVNTATDEGFLVWQQGGGLLDVPAAMAAQAFFTPANASFGIFKGNAPANGSVEIAIESGEVCSVTTVTGNGVISGPAGNAFTSASITDSILTVEFNGERDAWFDLYSGYVEVDCGTDGAYSVPWGAYVRR